MLPTPLLHHGILFFTFFCGRFDLYLVCIVCVSAKKYPLPVLFFKIRSNLWIERN